MPHLNDPAKTILHYDEAYFRARYGAILEDELNYRLLSLYWKEVLFVRRGLNIRGKVLDFGSGLGYVSAALEDSVCFDVSPFVLSELRRRGRRVVERREDLAPEVFDYLLSAHSLEHSPTPYQDLQEFRQFMKPGGQLVLVLPIETALGPTLQPDWNQHLQAWTFQTITNLLVATGWRPVHQSVVYSSYLLRTLGRRLPMGRAVQAARILGRLRRSYPAMLTIAQFPD